MKKKITIIIFFIIALVLIYSVIHISYKQVSNQTEVIQILPKKEKVIEIAPENETDEMSSMRLRLSIEKFSFKRYERIVVILTLTNYAAKNISIEYFPLSPFNVYLLDKNGSLLETFVGERTASMVPPIQYDLAPGESINGTVNFPLSHVPGIYFLSGEFTGKIVYPQENVIVTQEMMRIVSNKVQIEIVQ